MWVHFCCWHKDLIVRILLEFNSLKLLIIKIIQPNLFNKSILRLSLEDKEHFLATVFLTLRLKHSPNGDPLELSPHSSDILNCLFWTKLHIMVFFSHWLFPTARLHNWKHPSSQTDIHAMHFQGTIEVCFY